MIMMMMMMTMLEVVFVMIILMDDSGIDGIHEGENDQEGVNVIEIVSIARVLRH